MGGRGLLMAGYSYFADFGMSGRAIWTAGFLDQKGSPIMANKKYCKLELIWPDRVQSVNGYRGQGSTPNVNAIAWDGKRALYVTERHLNTEGERGLCQGGMDVLGIFINEKGLRISNLATGETVKPNKIMDSKLKKEPEGPKLDAFHIATGKAYQGACQIAAGPEGKFLVVWMEEDEASESRIKGRIVGE